MHHAVGVLLHSREFMSQQRDELIIVFVVNLAIPRLYMNEDSACVLSLSRIQRVNVSIGEDCTDYFMYVMFFRRKRIRKCQCSPASEFGENKPRFRTQKISEKLASLGVMGHN